MSPPAAFVPDSLMNKALRQRPFSDIQDTFLLPCTGFSHQQVAVRQRHPALQTDGGEVRIWQPVAPLNPQAWGKKKKKEPQEEGEREAEDNLSVADRE